MEEDLVNLTWLTRQPSEFIPHPPTPPASPNSSDSHKAQTSPQSPKKLSLPAVDYSRVPKKPKLSYAQLITEAMKAYGDGPVLLTDIYDWIKENYCFYRFAEPSWQNSVRHNLSLNKQFVKVARHFDDKGKGSYWRLDQTKKDPYCIRRRNFNPEASKPRNPKPTVDRPCVNPAIQTYLQRLQNKQRNHSEDSFSSSSGTDSDYVPNLDHIGAQEYVVTSNPSNPHSPNDPDPYEFDYRSLDPEEPRVRVEYNFECEYDFTPNCWASAKLPIHPQGTHGPLPSIQFSPNSSQTLLLGSVGMSPPSSDDASANQLELRIPTPDYLRHIGGSQNALLQSPTSYPLLAKIWENLNTSGSSGVGMPVDKPHPWQDPSLNAETPC